MGYVVDGPVGKSAAKAVVSESKQKNDGFKKGGSCMKKGGAAKGRKARAAGGGVMSSAHSGTPRGKASHY
jgi:hypothetical protein